MQKGQHSFSHGCARLLMNGAADSMLPCFTVSGDLTANQLRERFQPSLTHSLVGDYVNRLIDSSLGSHWTRLYDSVCFTFFLWRFDDTFHSISTTRNQYYSCIINTKITILTSARSLSGIDAINQFKVESNVCI